MPPPVSQVRAPQTGQVGMNGQNMANGVGKNSKTACWLVPHLHDCSVMTAGDGFEMAGGCRGRTVIARRSPVCAPSQAQGWVLV